MALRHLPPRPVHLLVAIAALLFAPSAASAAWTVTPTADVAGADLTNLSAVDCSSANSCMAVGHATLVQGAGAVTVAERWDGTSWQIVPTPNPPGATSSSLVGISCPWRNVCFAVGDRSTGQPGPNQTYTSLIELWNGTSWSIQPSPDVGNGGLSAVSCSGLLACTAIGGSDATGTLAERWDGTGWHVQSVPDAPGSQSSVLSDVSCPLKRTCTAVGQTNGVTIPLAPLVERWFGRVNSWGLQAAPKPAGADIAQFSGVSCPDGPVCFAVGESLGPPGPFFERDITTLAERRVGSSWWVMPTPNLTRPQGSRPLTELLGVSCPGRRACHAVGTGYGSAGPMAIAERFDGASWQLESIPTDGYVNPFLPGVSCPSRLFCMAVGGWDIVFAGRGDIGGTLAAKWTP